MVAAWAPKHRDAGARDGRLGRGAARLHALCEARAGSLATAGAAGFPAPPPPSPTRLDRSPALRDARLLALASGSSRYQLVVPGSSPCFLRRLEIPCCWVAQRSRSRRLLPAAAAAVSSRTVSAGGGGGVGPLPIPGAQFIEPWKGVADAGGLSGQGSIRKGPLQPVSAQQCPHA